MEATLLLQEPQTKYTTDFRSAAATDVKATSTPTSQSAGDTESDAGDNRGQDKAIPAEASGSSLTNPSSGYNVVVTMIDVIAVMPRVPGRVLRNVHPSSQLIPSTSHQAGTIIPLLHQQRPREGK